MVHPNSLKNLRKGIPKNATKEKCKYCSNLYWPWNLKQHFSKCVKNPEFGIPCVVCGELRHPKRTTCSRSCSNTYFRSGKNHPNYKGLSTENYRKICFNHWKKECCLCGFNHIVEVHHLDENSDNHDPNNLVPLCPNHHQMWHSRHKNLIEENVLTYIRNRDTLSKLV